MPQKHCRCLQNAGRIGILSQSFLDHSGGGTVDSFKHGILVANIGTACGTHTTLDLGSFIGDDIAVQIGQHEHLELVADLLIHKVRGHNINVPFVGGNLRILCRDLLADGRKFAVCLLHNIGLGNNRNPLFTVLPGIFKSRSGNAAGTGIGCDLKVHRHSRQVNTLTAQNILALRILPIEHPVNPLLRNTDRPHIGVQIQFPPQRHIGAFHGAAFGRGSGAFQKYVAGFDLRQGICRNRLIQGQTVFDGQARNGF